MFEGYWKTPVGNNLKTGWGKGKEIALPPYKETRSRTEEEDLFWKEVGTTSSSEQKGKQ